MMDDPTPLNAPTRATLAASIDELGVSADAKLWLKRALDISAEVGARVVAVGRQIVARLLEFARAFPATTFGAIVGFTIGALIGAIPYLGPLLGPVATPLLTALGIGKGAVQDLPVVALRARVTDLERSLAAQLARG